MGRGKIEIKKIENVTNRQVTYSKRRLGLMKKAKELTVLCDAEVSIILISSSGKFAEFCSPSTNTKKMIDGYQQVTGIDLWISQYEKMRNNLNHLKEINGNLRKELKKRIGDDDLEGLDMKELQRLEQDLDKSLTLVRKRKLKHYHEAYRTLLQELRELEALEERSGCVFATANELMSYKGPPTSMNMFELRFLPNQTNHGTIYESHNVPQA